MDGSIGGIAELDFEPKELEDFKEALTQGESEANKYLYGVYGAPLTVERSFRLEASRVL